MLCWRHLNFHSGFKRDLLMKHLIICREYPPAPGGGIGTYVQHLSQLLAERGETVHVIGQLWEGAEKPEEELCNGKLIVHRLPFEDWTAFLKPKPSSLIRSKEVKHLFQSDFPPQCFSWQASHLAERLVEKEGIDVIEAQEYEAPLYYFQLRRARGLGPRRRPPCLVHLHSPTELIAQHNDWSSANAQRRIAKVLEDHSISTADGLVCPSRFLAQHVEANHELTRGSVEVIPYPLCDSFMIERKLDTWSNGNIAYVGRLERRKGVLEWIEAAIKVALQYPTARFEFIGANVLGANRISSAAVIDRIVPRNLRARFIFRGELRRPAIPGFLKNARIAVVPSRWDNFPNTCMEAMASGLPVIASRQGGMAEMITDGETGWLVEKAEPDRLAEALRRALETPPAKIARMGSHAATSIRRICDPQNVVEQHLNFRHRLAKQRTRHSFRVASSEMKPATVEPVPFRLKRLRRVREQLATISCLIANPIVSVRVLRALTSK
jgi:glycosyltransferase involved in cell wall biosynthesis